jgi:hypothetical protein
LELLVLTHLTMESNQFLKDKITKFYILIAVASSFSCVRKEKTCIEFYPDDCRRSMIQ